MIYLKFVTNTRLGESQTVRLPFEVISVCVGAKIAHSTQQDYVLSIYETAAPTQWSYDFFYNIPNCQYRFNRAIKVSQKCYETDERVQEILCPAFLQLQGDTVTYNGISEDSDEDSSSSKYGDLDQIFLRVFAEAIETGSQDFLDFKITL